MARTMREDVREKIIDAAEKRLWHYGIKKTTIDEIASDAGVGKGTVYLYFDSKEDVALTIMARYKQQTIEDQTDIARDGRLETLEKLRQMLKLPLTRAHQKCAQFPGALEVVVALKPHLVRHMAPYAQQEQALLAEVLEEGNRRGVLRVDDTLGTARVLKLMTVGFLPPYPCVSEPKEMETEVDRMVALLFQGLRK